MTESCNNIENQSFDDIRPYDDGQFKEKIAQLVEEPGFEHAVRWVMPDVDYPEFVRNLLTVETQNDFQLKVMAPFLELLVSKTTHGLSMDGEENFKPGTAHVLITNHRDIVLDASFLNLCFIRNQQPTTQVAIGNNLLIYDWITDLVKLNRSFIVKRDTRVREALDAARHLSAYIHQTVARDHESVWIAQREGRAKDSSDHTQESVLKMLALGGGDDVRASLMELDILPVSISYEYDPNDYLKVREFLLKRRDPEYKKTQRDDLFSMETGLLQQKGHVHFHVGRGINRALSAVPEASKAEDLRLTCELIDREIHSGYRIYPCNYIAFDELQGSTLHSAYYTDDDVRTFNEYIAGQLAKVEEENITPQEEIFMRNMMLTMYANPLKNQKAATTVQS